MIENYTTIFLDLPYAIKGFLLYDAADDYYTIVINSRMSYEKNKETFEHEIEHIKNGDFHKYRNVGMLELALH